MTKSALGILLLSSIILPIQASEYVCIHEEIEVLTYTADGQIIFSNESESLLEDKYDCNEGFDIKAKFQDDGSIMASGFCYMDSIGAMRVDLSLECSLK